MRVSSALISTATGTMTSGCGARAWRRLLRRRSRQVAHGVRRRRQRPYVHCAMQRRLHPFGTRTRASRVMKGALEPLTRKRHRLQPAHAPFRADRRLRELRPLRARSPQVFVCNARLQRASQLLAKCASHRSEIFSQDWGVFLKWPRNCDSFQTHDGIVESVFALCAR